MKNKTLAIPLAPDGGLDLSALRDAPRPAVPALDTAAIMDAIRAEAAVRPVRAIRTRPALQAFTSIAAAAAIICSTLPILRAEAAADRNIVAAWTQSIDPAAIEATLTGDAPAEAETLYNVPNS